MTIWTMIAAAGMVMWAIALALSMASLRADRQPPAPRSWLV